MRTSIALAITSLMLLVVPGAFADRAYTDAVGDSGAAPDITGLTVSHDAAGIVTFAVVTNQPTLPTDASIWGFVDTDRDATTGFQARGLGADHFFIADADGGVLFHVVGNGISIDFNSSFQAGYSNGTLTARLDRRELGTTEKFAFLIEAEQSDANGDSIGSDFAPDAAPFYEYSFVPLVLTLAKPVGTPSAPVAGKAFTVVSKVSRNDGVPFAAGAVTCKVKAGQASLRTTATTAAGSVRCSMRVPKGAKSKMLRGSLTVGVEDASPMTRSFAFRIR